MENLIFKRYSSIERDKKTTDFSISSALDYFLNKANYGEGIGHILCVGQQKIHGTNFGITTDGVIFVANGRSGFLTEEDNFNGNVWVALVEAIKPQLKAIFDKLKEKYPNLIQVKFSGELAGGAFDGKHGENSKKVQGGTNYCIDNFIYLFDIRLFLPNEVKTDALSLDAVEPIQKVVNPKETVALFAEQKLLHAELLEFNGKTEHTLLEWLEWNDWTNFLAIKLSGKQITEAEGVVIKSVDDECMYIGDHRVVVKKINPKFEEFKNAKKDKKQKKKSVSLSPEAQHFLTLAIGCATQMRVDKVAQNQGLDASNFGIVDGKLDKKTRKQHFGQLVNAVIQDIIKDIKADGVEFDPTWMGIMKGNMPKHLAPCINESFPHFKT